MTKYFYSPLNSLHKPWRGDWFCWCFDPAIPNLFPTVKLKVMRFSGDCPCRHLSDLALLTFSKGTLSCALRPCPGFDTYYDNKYSISVVSKGECSALHKAPELGFVVINTLPIANLRFLLLVLLMASLFPGCQY